MDKTEFLSRVLRKYRLRWRWGNQNVLLVMLVIGCLSGAEGHDHLHLRVPSARIVLKSLDSDGGSVSGGIVRTVTEKVNHEVVLTVPTSYAQAYVFECNATYPVEWNYVGEGAPRTTAEVGRQFKDFYNVNTYTYQTILYMYQLEELQSGRYVCRGTNPEQEKLQVHYDLFVPGNGSQVLISNGEKKIFVPESKLLTSLPCEVTDPSLTVNLYKGDDWGIFQKVDMNDSIIFRPRKGFILKLHELPDPFGTYMCATPDNKRRRKLHLIPERYREKYESGQSLDGKVPVQMSYDYEFNRMLCCSGSSFIPRLQWAPCNSVLDCKIKSVCFEEDRCGSTSSRGGLLESDGWRDPGLLPKGCVGWKLRDGGQSDHGILKCSTPGVTQYQPYLLNRGHIFTDFDVAPPSETILTMTKTSSEPMYLGSEVEYHCNSTRFYFAYGIRWAFKRGNDDIEFVDDSSPYVVREKYSLTSHMRQTTFRILHPDIKAIICFVPIANSPTEWRTVSLPITIRDALNVPPLAQNHNQIQILQNQNLKHMDHLPQTASHSHTQEYLSNRIPQSHPHSHNQFLDPVLPDPFSTSSPQVVSILNKHNLNHLPPSQIIDPTPSVDLAELISPSPMDPLPHQHQQSGVPMIPIDTLSPHVDVRDRDYLYSPTLPIKSFPKSNEFSSKPYHDHHQHQHNHHKFPKESFNSYSKESYTFPKENFPLPPIQKESQFPHYDQHHQQGLKTFYDEPTPIQQPFSKNEISRNYQSQSQSQSGIHTKENQHEEFDDQRERDYLAYKAYRQHYKNQKQSPNSFEINMGGDFPHPRPHHQSKNPQRYYSNPSSTTTASTTTPRYPRQRLTTTSTPRSNSYYPHQLNSMSQEYKEPKIITSEDFYHSRPTSSRPKPFNYSPIQSFREDPNVYSTSTSTMKPYHYYKDQHEHQHQGHGYISEKDSLETFSPIPLRTTPIPQSQPIIHYNSQEKQYSLRDPGSLSHSQSQSQGHRVRPSSKSKSGHTERRKWTDPTGSSGPSGPSAPATGLAPTAPSPTPAYKVISDSDSYAHRRYDNHDEKDYHYQSTSAPSHLHFPKSNEQNPTRTHTHTRTHFHPGKGDRTLLEATFSIEDDSDAPLNSDDYYMSSLRAKERRQKQKVKSKSSSSPSLSSPSPFSSPLSSISSSSSDQSGSSSTYRHQYQFHNLRNPSPQPHPQSQPTGPSAPASSREVFASPPSHSRPQPQSPRKVHSHAHASSSAERSRSHERGSLATYRVQRPYSGRRLMRNLPNLPQPQPQEDKEDESFDNYYFQRYGEVAKDSREESTRTKDQNSQNQGSVKKVRRVITGSKLTHSGEIEGQVKANVRR